MLNLQLNPEFSFVIEFLRFINEFSHFFVLNFQLRKYDKYKTACIYSDHAYLKRHFQFPRGRKLRPRQVTLTSRSNVYGILEVDRKKKKKNDLMDVLFLTPFRGKVSVFAYDFIAFCKSPSHSCKASFSNLFMFKMSVIHFTYQMQKSFPFTFNTILLIPLAHYYYNCP